MPFKIFQIVLKISEHFLLEFIKLLQMFKFKAKKIFGERRKLVKNQCFLSILTMIKNHQCAQTKNSQMKWSRVCTQPEQSVEKLLANQGVNYRVLLLLALSCKIHTFLRGFALPCMQKLGPTWTVPTVLCSELVFIHSNPDRTTAVLSFFFL